MFSTEPVAVFRGGSDRKGNSSKAQVLDDADEPVLVDVAFGWGGVSAGRNFRAESAEVSPVVYVRRGADVRPRDRLQRSNGERYAVVGHALWDQPGGVSVFGDVWVCFQLEAVNG